MGFLERRRREEQARHEELEREWARESAQRAIEYDELARHEAAIKELKEKAKNTLNNSHFPEIIKALEDENLIDFDIDYYVWQEDGDVSLDSRKETHQSNIKGHPYSVGYYFSKRTLDVAKSSFAGTVEWDYFAIEARADGRITLHSRHTRTINSDISFEEQDRALDKAHSSPLHDRKDWKTSADGFGLSY